MVNYRNFYTVFFHTELELWVYFRNQYCTSRFHEIFAEELWKHSVEKREILSHWKKISSNQLFSNFFSKTIAFTKFLRKKCEREFLQFPHYDLYFFVNVSMFSNLSFMFWRIFHYEKTKVDLTQIWYKKVVRVFSTLCTTSQIVMKNKDKVFRVLY